MTTPPMTQSVRLIDVAPAGEIVGLFFVCLIFAIWAVIKILDVPEKPR